MATALQPSAAQLAPVAEPQTMWDQIFSGLVPGSIGLPTFPQAAPQQQGQNQSALSILGGESASVNPDAARALTEIG